MQRTGMARGRSTTWLRRHAGISTGAITGGAILAVLMMVVPTSVGSAAPHTLLSAPYKKAAVVLTNPKSSSGCGGGSLLTLAYFNKTTGFGGFSDNVSTTWCSMNTNNSAKFTGSIQVSIPVKVKTTGPHTIQAIWVTQATGSVNLTAGTCKGSATVLYTGCTRSARAFVYGSATLLDKTTHKKKGPSNVWPGNFTYVSNYTACRLTVCTSTATAKSVGSFNTGTSFWVWDWNSTSMNATHNYSLKMTVFGGVNVILMVNGATLSGASANAQMNSGTLGMYEQLYSISVS